MTAAAIGACSSPEESAREALTEAVEDWQAALGEADPRERVAAYGEVIEAVENVAEDYPDTPDGRAIAGGREVVGGRSLEALRAVRDELAARAACYSSPTVDCLTPFASQNTRGAAAGEGGADAVFAEARKAVCARGFAAADRTLEPFKINKPVYAAELIQVALAAAECDKPGEVVAAIDAYRTVAPSDPAERAGQLLSIVSTESLRPAWPSVMAELEQMLVSGRLAGNDAASVALTMAQRYAALGDTSAALAKYRYFTDTLGYEADWSSKLELGSTLIAAGAAAEGLAIVENNNMRSYSVITVAEAAAELARQIGLLSAGSSAPQLYNVKDIRDYFSPVSGTERKRVDAASAAIEAELDKLVPVVTIQDGAVTKIDTAYATLALVQQKLGASDKADALLGKGRAFRGHILGQGAEGVGLDQFNAFATLVALGQGKHAESAELVQAINVRHDYSRLILKSFAEKGDVEQCLALANTIQPNVRQSYTTVIESLISAGRIEDAERAIAAYAGNADEKRGLYWMLAQQAATDGDLERAEELAGKYSLVTGPQDRLRLLGVLLSAEKIGGSRREAEPLIREVFTIGSQFDAADGGVFDRNNNAVAQNAAWHAFHNGYTDLGVELYTAASRKDQRPLFEAFNDKLDKREMPELLMLAHDNLHGETLGYVIDAAIRYLNREAV